MPESVRSVPTQLMLDLPSPTATDDVTASPELDIDSYDHIVICLSGGKDSIACLLYTLELTEKRSTIELWHHDVDGREGSTLMDWPFMADYIRKIAATFELPVYFSWLVGGFEGEMLKQNAASNPHITETPDGTITLPRDSRRMALSTRMRFPQVSASLQTRWCSSALKIDVARRALNNQSRFNNSRTLFITGERREESSNRAKYYAFEPHACDRRKGRLKRHIDTWRPVLDWTEQQVWECLRRNGFIQPVPYRLGWSRSSCRTCIYNSDTIWATIDRYFPESAKEIAAYEKRFNTTISRSKRDVLSRAATTTPIDIDDLEALAQASRPDYTLPILCNPADWLIPKGALSRSSCGPD